MASKRAGRGQILQRGGKWQAKVYIGRDEETAKRRHLSRNFETKKAAQKWLTKVHAQRDEGTFVEPSQVTLRKFLRQWLDDAVKARVRVRTFDDYENIIRRYIEPSKLAPMKLAKIQPSHIQSLYTHMLDPKPEQDGITPILSVARKLSPRTVEYVHVVLHGAFKQAVRWGMLASNPCARVAPPKKQRREMLAFTPEQAATFLQNVEGHRYGPLYTLLLATGLRPGEALALRWTDLDGDTLRVQRTLVMRAGIPARFEEPKTNRSRRSVPLPAVALKALGAHRKRQAEEKLASGPAYQDQAQLIFATPTGSPIPPGDVSHAFAKAVKAAGLPRLRLYDLRHSAATLLLAAGESLKVISELLGHSTITLTGDVYAHVSESMQRQVSAKLDALLSAHPNAR